MRRIYQGLGLCGLGLLGFVGYLWALQVTGNLHVVVPGVVYRAGQVTPEQIADLAEREGVRSILNLRGAANGAAWYEDEVAASAEHGLVHADFEMRSSQILTEARAEALIELMRSLPAPILIHCEHGADRSGLASALYLSAVLNAGEAAAEAQLSLRFGHFPVPYLSGAWPMDQSFELLEPMLGYLDS